MNETCGFLDRFILNLDSDLLVQVVVQIMKCITHTGVCNALLYCHEH